MPRRLIVHTLKIGLVGEPAPLCLRITKRDAKLLAGRRHVLEPSLPFFHGASPSGATVAISLQDVQFANVPWAQPENVAPVPTLPETDRIDIRLRHRPSLGSGVADPQAAYFLMSTLAVSHVMGRLPEFLEYLDEDGEGMWIRPDQLGYLSTPKWVMDAGLRAFEEDCEAEAAAVIEQLERSATAEKLIAEVNMLPPKPRQP